MTKEQVLLTDDAKEIVLRKEIIAEIMKLVDGRWETVEPRPTIDELEQNLNSDEPSKLRLNPDGSVSKFLGNYTVKDVADAIMRVISATHPAPEAPAELDVPLGTAENLDALARTLGSSK